MVDSPADSAPCVTLTIGELKDLVRNEIRGALRLNGQGSENPPEFSTSLAPKPFLTVSEAAELARVGTSTIRLYIRKGKLKPRKVGRRVIVARAELERFLGP